MRPELLRHSVDGVLQDPVTSCQLLFFDDLLLSLSLLDPIVNDLFQFVKDLAAVVELAINPLHFLSDESLVVLPLGSSQFSFLPRFRLLFVARLFVSRLSIPSRAGSGC